MEMARRTLAMGKGELLMWTYTKALEYPIKIKCANPRLAKFIISQYGGPDGELAASLRYLSQRFGMPDQKAKAILNDIGTEELAHLEMVGTIVHQLTDGASIEEIEKADRGSDIILYIDDDCKEFLEEARISGLLKKYCSFLPVPIAFGKKKEWKDGKQVETTEDNIINDATPLWTRKPSELSDEDYKSFYSKLYPMSDEPLFWIHLNVDYPFHLTGILYFPKVKSNI